MQFFKLIGKNHQTQVSDCLLYEYRELEVHKRGISYMLRF